MEGIILFPPKNECTYSLSGNKHFLGKLFFQKRQFLSEVGIYLLLSEVKNVCHVTMITINR